MIALRQLCLKLLRRLCECALAIREYIENLEDLYMAEQRLKDFRAGKSKAIPLEDVMKSY